jgi:hypothetical protein
MLLHEPKRHEFSAVGLIINASAEVIPSVPPLSVLVYAEGVLKNLQLPLGHRFTSYIWWTA